MISAPAPITQSSPIVSPSRNVAFTPTKQRSPMVQFPETTTCEAMKQWSPISIVPDVVPAPEDDVVPDPHERLEDVLLEDEAVVAELGLGPAMDMS